MPKPFPLPLSRYKGDVLVVGGGPGGSTVGVLLAERGRDVVTMARARDPRFDAGEALLPAIGELFRRLDEVEPIGMALATRRGTRTLEGHRVRVRTLESPYRAVSLAHLPRSWRAWRRRRADIRSVSA